MIAVTINAKIEPRMSNKGPDVLERSCLPAGKVFIRAGEENARAYIIQNGEISAFTMEDDEKIEVERFGPGTMIGEQSLIIAEPAKLSYEALVATTVVVITRQDFEKRLIKAGKSVKAVVDHAVSKLAYYEDLEMKKALDRTEIDDSARTLVQGLLTGLSEDKKIKYEKAMLPHINGLIKEIKEIKKKG